MKKLSVIVYTFILWAAFSAFTIPANPGKKELPQLRASEVMISIGVKGEKISLQQLSLISRNDLESLTGKKLNLVQRLAFKGAQKKLQRAISDSGVITNKKLKKMFYADGDAGFHLGGFALGFLIGPIGVLIAYLIRDDLQSSRIKWSWIGFGVSVVLGLIFLVL